MFDLMRPCVTCPFRKGLGSHFQLRRLEDIRRDVAFQCHKTVDYEAWNDEVKRQGDRPQQCAGLMALLHRMNEPNQIMRVAERIGVLDCAKLDPENEVYATWAEAVRAHEEGVEQ
jgi:hypothetical protein